MFTAETCARKKPEVAPENRVGDFFSVSITCAGQNQSQALELHQALSTTNTTTASGVVCWLSKDPIGISGGLNLYAFCGNNPINARDPLGLCEDNDDNIPAWYKPGVTPPKSWPPPGDGWEWNKRGYLENKGGRKHWHPPDSKHPDGHWDLEDKKGRQTGRDFEMNVDPEVVENVAKGATWGVVTYWIISEGSRILFPPRNLVPVP